jgi:quercetin 2,3-dioxygenase
MLLIRRAADRGRANLGWLDSRHTFSFADYSDPRYMGFGPLRVINEDRVQPGKGFPTHSHRDMEIISYVLAGALEHKDSIGTGSVIRPGDVQRMTAGTGVQHSEFNHSPTEPVHFLQIWVIPEKRGLAPSYEEKRFDDDSKRGKLKLIASRTGRDESVVIHRDTDLYAAVLAPGDEVAHSTDRLRKSWLQVARGAITIDDETLNAGDGTAIAYEERIVIKSTAASEFLLFDMG